MKTSTFVMLLTKLYRRTQKFVGQQKFIKFSAHQMIWTLLTCN